MYKNNLLINILKEYMYSMNMSNMKDCDCRGETIAMTIAETTAETIAETIETIDERVKEDIRENEILNSKTKKIEIPDERVWTAFMAHIAHSEAKDIEADLGRLQTKYIMGLEKEKYEHFHFLVLMTKREYTAFAKRLFIDKYKLRGRAVKDKPRQYGKEKAIRNLEKYTKYCIKDQNFRSNMSHEEIEMIIKDKIENVRNTKDRTYQLKELLLEYLDDHVTRFTPSHYPSVMSRGEYEDNYLAREIKIKIVDFMRQNKLIIRKNVIDMYYYYAITYSENANLKKSSAKIIDSLYYNCT